MQIIAQATRQESSTYQPPLPLKIVRKGFGFLSGLPPAMQNPPYVQIDDITAGWSTAEGTCQVTIADWTDTDISLPVGAVDGAGTTLSPLRDMSPLSFFQPTSQAVNCPVAASDSINVKITNPQSGNYESLPNPVPVLATGTTPSRP